LFGNDAELSLIHPHWNARLFKGAQQRCALKTGQRALGHGTCPQKMLQPQRKMHQPKIERMHFSVLHFSEICYHKGTLRRLWCGREGVYRGLGKIG